MVHRHASILTPYIMRELKRFFSFFFFHTQKRGGKVSSLLTPGHLPPGASWSRCEQQEAPLLPPPKKCHFCVISPGLGVG